MDTKLKYKAWIGEKHADIAHKLRGNDIETFALEFAEYLVKNRSVPDVVEQDERFSSEGEILQWLHSNTPFAIKPKSKHAKRLLVNPFTSNHAFKEVCKHLANKMYNASQHRLRLVARISNK